ncbi:ThiF family adenylyltransferase [Natribacillus halophilus]|uniref:Adenylyltransferase and sulfurtransferase n=1 Tax=Natribacillus halophilus TaxID=549003 RepID=A0A1G8MYY0_9BACI|nr:ThiF family adenylyltransferase [Natribacillus halophilus]SDI73181.1 adenylyltransferase and sulfurtransferase [Natribacillus halophilus]
MDRYSRQISFKPMGTEGQHRLAEAHALIVGVGALGSTNAEMLVRAGIGTLTVIDRDYVETSNLHRQQLYTEADAADELPKAVAAKTHLQAINQETDVRTHIMDANAENLEPLLVSVDLMIDGTDNFDIRFIINDLAAKYEIPWLFGAFAGSYGMAYMVRPWDGPCLNCLLASIPSSVMTCESDGVIAPVVQQTALLQLVEAMKWMTGNRAEVEERLVIYDVWRGEQQRLDVQRAKAKDCPTCGEAPVYPYLTTGADTKTAVLCGRDTVQISPEHQRSFDLTHLEAKLQVHGKTKRNPYLLSCVLDDHRLAIFQDGRVLIHGTKNIDHARDIYETYVL